TLPILSSLRLCRDPSAAGLGHRDEGRRLFGRAVPDRRRAGGRQAGGGRARLRRDFPDLQGGSDRSVPGLGVLPEPGEERGRSDRAETGRGYDDEGLYRQAAREREDRRNLAGQENWSLFRAGRHGSRSRTTIADEPDRGTRGGDRYGREQGPADDGETHEAPRDGWRGT